MKSHTVDNDPRLDQNRPGVGVVVEKASHR
jgi:hypothetical protein